MKYFHKKRLLKLAMYLREIPRRQFDLNIIAEKVTGGCGYTACAIGNCPLVFRGVKYASMSNYPGDNYFAVRFPNGKMDFDGAKWFFGINEGQSRYLFLPVRYPKGKRGKMTVAKRIERFVETNGEYEELYHL